MKHTEVSVEPDRTRQAAMTGLTRIPVRWHRKKNGAVFPVEITATHFVWQGRNVHLAAIRDVTEQHRAAEAIRESEERFHRAFHANPSLLAICTPGEGRYLDVNEAFHTALGYTREEMIGRTSVELGIWPETSRREEVLEIMEKAGSIRNAEVQVRDKHGAIHHELVSTEKVQLRGQDAYLVNMVDITERKRMEARLQQGERMAALGTLVASVAHEINNPNSFIALNAPVLQEVWQACLPVLRRHQRETGGFVVGAMDFDEACKRVPELLAAILRASERIGGTIRQLRDYAQPAQHPDKVPVQVNEVVTAALVFCEHEVSRVTRHFRTRLPSDLPPVLGDANRLEQVVRNLVLNACQAMRDPEGAICIATKHCPSRGMIELEVADEGVGIVPEVLSRLGEPFFTSKRAHGGMGLGLAIASAIIREHDGEILFESMPGKGTSVRVLLPALHEDR